MSTYNRTISTEEIGQQLSRLASERHADKRILRRFHIAKMAACTVAFAGVLLTGYGVLGSFALAAKGSGAGLMAKTFIAAAGACLCLGGIIADGRLEVARRRAADGVIDRALGRSVRAMVLHRATHTPNTNG